MSEKKGKATNAKQFQIRPLELLLSLLFILVASVYLRWRRQGDCWYKIPCSLPHLGDKSIRYQWLRWVYDTFYLPEDEERTIQFIGKLRQDTFKSRPNERYNVSHCPEQPPQGYPFSWNVLQVLENWPTNVTTIPAEIYQSLCIFDYESDRSKIVKYRDAEVPFLVRNDYRVLQTAERWNQKHYLVKLLGDLPHRTEISNSSYFLYWTHPKLANRRLQKLAQRTGRSQQRVDISPEWIPPTQMTHMTITEWIDHAHAFNATDQPYYYFQLAGCGNVSKCEPHSSEFLFDELPFFQPREDQLYVKDAKHQKGIHCRFGIKGTTIANHFDGSRNTIVLLKGARRYLLAHPDQCSVLGLYPMTHPSSRHSAINWSDPDLKEFPSFQNALVHEVVLQAGDVLFLPTHYFHHIISLEQNVQCNTRGGISDLHLQTMKDCGFAGI